MTAAPSPDVSLVSHLECSASGERYENDRLHGLSMAGAPLLVRYDLSALATTVSKADLAARPADLWRYREFLPLPDESARVCRSARA